MPVRILLIDDDAVDRRAVCRALQNTSLEAEVREVDSATAGLQLLQEEAFDCVLLDYHLPDMDGLGFLGKLSTERGLPVVPVVMLTGHGSQALAVAALQQGVQDYLLKDGLQPAALQRAISRAMEVVALRRQHQHAQEELARRAEALTHLNARLTRSNTDLEQFAYAVSHDLQEPLRQVEGFAALLGQGYADQFDARAAQYLHQIMDGSTRMQQLIHDMLEYSRISRGDIVREPTSIEDVLRQTLAILAPRLAETQAEVTYETLPTVLAHPGQLGQLWQNLLSNALKFRSQAPPRIHITATPVDQAWVVAVRDNGIGIAPQFAERIFQLFQRLHTRTEYPGTGIGLALCQKIVERHGGRIWVESQPGHGATFSFTLPQYKAAGACAAGEA